MRPRETRPTCRRRPSFPTTGSSARPTWWSTSAPISPSPPSGDDIYRCFVVPTHLDKDQYVSAVEYRPGNRRVVHHILAYVDTSGKARERDQAEPGPGYTCFGGPGEPIHGGLGGWAPGNRPTFLADGIGRSLPGQSDIIVQVHYHPRGKAETDRSKIGLYFSKKPIKQIMHWGIVINPGLELPPGQSNIEVKAAWEVPVDVTAHSVTPHMHLLGRDMQISVKFPDGHVQDLIKIADWDFNWQYTYHFEKPLDIPKGSLVYLVSHYDNSASNPQEPPQAPQARQVGRGDDRRDVHRLPRRDQEGPGPDQARRERRLHGHLAEATGRATGEVRKAIARSGDPAKRSRSDAPADAGK